MKYEAYGKIFWSSAFLIFLDQVSKYTIRHEGGFYVCNPNIAFGINLSPIIFWLCWIIIIVILLVGLKKLLRVNNPEEGIVKKSLSAQKNKMVITALVFILAGAVSNIIDRIFLGCVVDFIDWKIWPIFNLADCFVFFGAFMLLVKFKKM